MKTIPYLMLFALLSMCAATAENKGEQEEWMREAIRKEISRASEAHEIHTDTKRFEGKYESAKEKHPQQFSAMMEAHKKAAEAWSKVRNVAKEATHPDSVAESKQLANAASAEANLAEMALRYVTAAAERASMIEKSGNNRDLRALAEKLDANEKAIYLAQRARNEAQASAEKLQAENLKLNSELRAVYEKAREKNRGNETRDRERDKKREPEKDKREPRGGDDFNPLGS